MRIAAQIVEHLLRPGERLLGIDHPLVRMQPRDEIAPVVIGHYLLVQLPVVSRPEQGSDEFPPEHARERLHRKQKAALGPPPISRGTERPTGHQRMDMHVPPQILLPTYAAPV